MSTNIFGGDEVDAIVFDVGACNARAGYAGEDAPKAVFPSSCGVIPRLENGNAAPMEIDGESQGNGKHRSLYTGSQAVNYRRDQQEVVPAVEDGVCNDWELMESIWHHALQDRLHVDPKEHPILLAEPTIQPRESREKTVELMFEKFNAPAVFLARNAVLSSFANGRQTSLNVDMGYSGTTMQSRGVTVHPPYSFKRTEITPGQYQATSLDLPGTTDSFRSFQVERIVADVKETICRVSDTAFDAEANANIPTVEYELPDGQLIQIGPDRFSIPEILFQPTVLKSFRSAAQHLKPEELKSIPASITKGIELCDVDIRKDLYSGVLVTGATSLLPQLRERLERDLAESAPQAAKVKVIMPANTIERRFSVWIGGSILASLGTFQQMWVSKKEYEDYGASLIHKRAPDKMYMKTVLSYDYGGKDCVCDLLPEIHMSRLFNGVES